MQLKNKAKNLPKEPGVYLMKDKRGEIIYVGKAKVLRNRVSSYFQERDNKRFKVKILVEHLHDFDYIITDTEVEALILENNLIKKHNPRFNVQLKDDKTYPHIKVSNELYPRITKTRVIKQDGSDYFGPYTNVKAVNDMLELLHDLFSLRTCKKDLTRDKEKECLNYHIEKCVGPCINEVSVKEYNKLIEQAVMILKGKENNLVKKLEQEMETKAEQQEFEEAAKLRDQIQAIETITEKQKVVSDKLIDQDVIALYEEDGVNCLQLLIIRNGQLLGKEEFIFEEDEQEEVLMVFMQQYYDNSYYIPQEIILEFDFKQRELLADWLDKQSNNRVELIIPQRGQKKKLVAMAQRNAKYNLKEYKMKEGLKRKKETNGVKELKDLLELDKHPWRIEGFDISNLQGSDTVASLVVFENGSPKKSHYRRFKIKEVEGIDDFASMEEVIRRRYSRLLDENRQMPDLILIDGGKGQLNSAHKILNNLGCSEPELISLAKREEEVFKPQREESILLPRNSEALYLVQRVRDEAHRFAVSYHRKLRSRRLTHSMLDDIPGIGPSRRKALLNHFASMSKIKKASVEELSEVDGISDTLAKQIRDYLKRNLRP